MNARLVAITTILLLVISGCGYNPERDKDWPGCDLYRADLTGANLYRADLVAANLYGADLTRANLSGAVLVDADLTGANLDDVFSPNYSGASNVPPEYLKD